MDKYATHYSAWSIIDDNYVTVSAPSTQISNKLIKKSELSTYSLKLSSNPKKEYTNNQCVLQTDIVPSYTNTNIASLIITNAYHGLLDTTLDGAFFYVTEEGPYELVETYHENPYYTNYIFSTNSNSTFPTQLPYNNRVEYVITGCKGSNIYTSGGKDYVEYGIGFELIGNFYSYYTGINIVGVDVSCYVNFWNGSMNHYTERFYPISSTPVGTDGPNTVYEHYIDIRFNKWNDIGTIRKGFIDCGTGEVKSIEFSIDVYGAP
jgi:hypothetical protein